MNDVGNKEKDYYIDANGNKVFTAEFLKKRGHCCHSGCLHCPYPPKTNPLIPVELQMEKIKEDEEVYEGEIPKDQELD